MKSQTSNITGIIVHPRSFGAWFLVLLWSLVLGAWSFPTHAADTDAVLDGWFAAQTNLQTWTADFTQTRSLKTLTQPLVATGHLWFATPNRFRWELGQPAQTIALRNKDEMFVVYPRLKRAERYPAGEKAGGEWRDMLELLDAGFPRSRAEMKSRFQILSITDKGGNWELAMQPASPVARRIMKEIRLGLATNDFSLLSTEMIFVDGSSMRNDFTNSVLNPKLDESVFEWKPPPDFKVTDPMKR